MNPVTGDPEILDGVQRPFSSIAALGLSHDFSKLTAGLAWHGTHWLGTGRVTSGGQTFKTIPALALMRAELFGTYHFSQTTSARASASKGLKTDADPSTFAIYDMPEEMAGFSVSVGLQHVF
jgi:hypothetical protein